MAEPKVCTVCGTIAKPERSMNRGSPGMEIFLWLVGCVFFFLPGIIYSIWRRTSSAKRCSACGSTSLVPLDTPRGRSLVKEHAVTPDGTVVGPAVVGSAARGRAYLIGFGIFILLVILSRVMR